MGVTAGQNLVDVGVVCDAVVFDGITGVKVEDVEGDGDGACDAGKDTD